MNVPHSLVREDPHARTVLQRAHLLLGFGLVFLAAGGYWLSLFALYGVTLKGDWFAARFLVLAFLVAYQGYLHMQHSAAYEAFCAGFVFYLGIFGGLTLFVPYRDDALGLSFNSNRMPLSGQQFSSFNEWLAGAMPQECWPAINFEGILFSQCPLETVYHLWFFILGLPYAILGINGISADFFTGLAFALENRSMLLGFFYIFQALPLFLALFAGFTAIKRKAPFTAVQLAGAILFEFFYHGMMGGGAFTFTF